MLEAAPRTLEVAPRTLEVASRTLEVVPRTLEVVAARPVPRHRLQRASLVRRIDKAMLARGAQIDHPTINNGILATFNAVKVAIPIYK